MAPEAELPKRRIHFLSLPYGWQQTCLSASPELGANKEALIGPHYGRIWKTTIELARRSPGIKSRRSCVAPEPAPSISGSLRSTATLVVLSLAGPLCLG